MKNKNPPWLSDLLDKTDKEMRIRNYSPKTRKLYRGHLERFYRDRGGTDPLCTTDECKAWLVAILDRGRSHSYMSQAISALKLVHEAVLNRPGPMARVPRPKRERTLPTVLSRNEVRRLTEAVKDPKHRALVVLLYSAGLRIGEALRLRVQDVDEERRIIHVRSGKGKKDRMVMLARVAAEELEAYQRFEEPTYWLFPGAVRRDRHLCPRTLQRTVTLAARKAGILKRVTPHSSLLCNSSAGGWHRSPLHPASTGPQEDLHHRDLHPRGGSGPGGDPEPRGPDLWRWGVGKGGGRPGRGGWGGRIGLSGWLYPGIIKV